MVLNGAEERACNSIIIVLTFKSFSGWTVSKLTVKVNSEVLKGRCVYTASPQQVWRAEPQASMWYFIYGRLAGSDTCEIAKHGKAGTSE